MMMIIGRETLHSNPTVQVPPWDDPTDHIHSPLFDELEMAGYDDVSDESLPVDAFSCDHFRMYEFKVRRCARGRSHDWTECPYAHPGEKARRRDPRKFHYSGTPCPEFRKGTCQRGDTCEFAHGVFECWLHPSRYRTQPCKDGVACRRRICFFAHTPDQLRLLPPPSQLGVDSYNGSPSQLGVDSYNGSPSQLGLSQLVPSQLGVDSYDGSPSWLGGVDSPTSTLYRSPSSPPMSPIGLSSVSELSSGVRNMQIGSGSGGRFSPRNMCNLRVGLGFTSLPSTPSERNGVNSFDIWDRGCGGGGGSTMEEPIMERVESGKQIRAKIYAKLSRENSLGGRVDSGVEW